jgi:hypothetical protein
VEPPPACRPDSLLDLLPDAHAQAILLRAAGADHEAIGRALGVPAESVRTLLEVADAKLSAATAARQAPGDLDERSGLDAAESLGRPGSLGEVAP